MVGGKEYDVRMILVANGVGIDRSPFLFFLHDMEIFIMLCAFALMAFAVHFYQ